MRGGPGPHAPALGLPLPREPKAGFNFSRHVLCAPLVGCCRFGSVRSIRRRCHSALSPCCTAVGGSCPEDRRMIVKRHELCGSDFPALPASTPNQQ